MSGSIGDLKWADTKGALRSPFLFLCLRGDGGYRLVGGVRGMGLAGEEGVLLVPPMPPLALVALAPVALVRAHEDALEGRAHRAPAVHLVQQLPRPAQHRPLGPQLRRDRLMLQHLGIGLRLRSG